MKITMEAETDVERETSPIPIEITGMEVFALIGLRRDEATGLAVPEERFQSTKPIGLPLLVGMLDVAQAKIKSMILQPPQSKIQRPVVMPQFNGPLRM